MAESIKADIQDLIKQLTPETPKLLDEMRSENRLIVDAIGNTNTGLGNEISSQMQKLLEEQNEASLFSINKSRGQMEKLAEVIEANQESLGADYDTLKDAIRRSNDASEFARDKVKQVGSLIGSAAKNVAVDLASVAAGVFADSPALMLATKWIGDGVQKVLEDRKKKKMEQDALDDEIKKQEEEALAQKRLLMDAGLNEEEISLALKKKKEADLQRVEDEKLQNAMEAMGITEEMLQRVNPSESPSDTPERVEETQESQSSSTIENHLSDIVNTLTTQTDQTERLAAEAEIGAERQAVLANETAREEEAESDKQHADLMDALERIGDGVAELKPKEEKDFGLIGLLLGGIGLAMIAANEFAKGLIQGVRDASLYLNKAFDGIKALGRGIMNGFKTIGEAFRRIFSLDALKPIGEGFSRAIAKVTEVLKPIKNAIVSVVEGGKAMLSNIVTPIKNVFNSVKGFLGGVVGEGSAISKVFGFISNGFKKFSSIFGTIGRALASMSDFTRPLIKIVGGLARTVGRLFAPLMAIIDGVVGFVKGFMSGDGLLDSLWKGITGAIEGIVVGFAEGMKMIFFDIPSIILDFIGLDALGDALGAIGDTLIDGLKGLFGGLWDIVEGIFTLDWGLITGGVGKMVDAVLGVFTGIFDALSNAASRILNTLTFGLLGSSEEELEAEAQAEEEAAQQERTQSQALSEMGVGETTEQRATAFQQQYATAEDPEAEDALARKTAEYEAMGIDFAEFMGDNEIDNMEAFEQAAAGMNSEQMTDLYNTGSAVADWSEEGDARIRDLIYQKGLEEGRITQTPTPTQGAVGAPSEDIVEFIRDQEGFSPEAYWDHQQWSIGHGTKADGPGATITPEEADLALRENVAGFREEVVRFSEDNGYDWNQNQIDAMTSFTYNGGTGWLDQVTAGGTRSNEEIQAKMLEYNRASGQVMPALVARRQQEAALFGTEVDDTMMVADATPSDIPELVPANVEDSPVATPAETLTPSRPASFEEWAERNPNLASNPSIAQAMKRSFEMRGRGEVATGAGAQPGDISTFQGGELVSIDSPQTPEVSAVESIAMDIPDMPVLTNQGDYFGGTDMYTTETNTLSQVSQPIPPSADMATGLVEAFIPAITSTTFIETVADRVGQFFGFESGQPADMMLAMNETASGLYGNDQFTNPADLYMEGRYIDGVSTENNDLAQTSNIGLVNNSPTTVISNTSNATTAIASKMPVRNDKGSFSDLNARNSYW